MIDFFQSLFGAKVEYDTKPAPLREGEVFPVGELAPADASPGYIQSDGSAARHGRVPYVIPTGAWSPRWVAPRDRAFRAAEILELGDRVVVVADVQWELLDHQGKSLAQVRKKEGGPTLDPKSKRIYALNSDGQLGAYRLTDGKLEFVFRVAFGGSYGRSFLAPMGERLVLVGHQRDLTGETGQSPHSVIESFSFAKPEKIDEASRDLLSLKESLATIYTEPTLFAVAAGPGLVLAGTNRIFGMGPDLFFEGVYTDEFQPLGLSADEGDRLYLAVRKKEKMALWSFNPAGQLFYRADLPMASAPLVRPPLVDYDHRVCLLTERRLVVIDSSGELVWARSSPAPIAGAVVTADNRLLVTAGSEILIYDQTGERTVLMKLPEVARTAPVLTAAGTILVATDNRVFCLEAKPAKPPGGA